jgi:hypothetical protein
MRHLVDSIVSSIARHGMKYFQGTPSPVGYKAHFRVQNQTAQTAKYACIAFRASFNKNLHTRMPKTLFTLLKFSLTCSGNLSPNPECIRRSHVNSTRCGRVQDAMRRAACWAAPGQTVFPKKGGEQFILRTRIKNSFILASDYNFSPNRCAGIKIN